MIHMFSFMWLLPFIVIPRLITSVSVVTRPGPVYFLKIKLDKLKHPLSPFTVYKRVLVLKIK